jgi:hypothetical protein
MCANKSKKESPLQQEREKKTKKTKGSNITGER